MGCGKQKYFIKDCWNKKSNKGAKGSNKIKVIKEARDIGRCLIRSFAFYYNNLY